jgi:hypothetical protein
LLFSDIEGSTSMLEQLGPERYAEVLHAKHGDVVPAVEQDDLSGQASTRLELDDGVVLARDNVRGGDDEVGRRDPAGPFDADAARRSQDADDAG